MRDYALEVLKEQIESLRAVNMQGCDFEQRLKVAEEIRQSVYIALSFTQPSED